RSNLQSMNYNLDDRVSSIIKLRFLLESEAPLTLEEFGHQDGITRYRFRHQQDIAYSKMRRIMIARERQHTAEEVEVHNREKQRMEVFREFYQAAAAQAAS